jgi:hypothetical protein
MQYLVCSRCGFANELIETACVKCGTPLDPAQAHDSAELSQAAMPPAPAPGPPPLPFAQTALSGTGRAAGAVFRAAMHPLDNLEGEYPWAHRFIGYLRVIAKILYVLGLLGIVLGLLVGIVTSISMGRVNEGFFSGAAAITGGILVSIISAVVGGLLVWLNYMFLMALPDFLECLLRIESNTRVRV